MVVAKLFRVDLPSKTWEVEELDEDILHKWLGGRGLGLNILRDSPNSVVISRGVLSNVIGVPGRATAYFISPKTNNIFYSSAGGNVQKMSPFAIVLDGVSEERLYLHIGGDGVTFYDAGAFFDANVRESLELLENRHPNKIILTAGATDDENAVLANNHHAFFGRGGLGAVLRGMGVKALVIEPLSGSSARINSEILLKLRRNKIITQLTKDGTVGMLLQELGRRNLLPVEFDWKELLNAWKSFNKSRYPCVGCPIACKKNFEFWGGLLTFYSSAGADFSKISEMYGRLNDAGLDAISFPIMSCSDHPIYSLAVNTSIRQDQNQLVFTKMFREGMVEDPVDYIISVQDEIAVVDSLVSCGFSLYAWDLGDYSEMLGTVGLSVSSEDLRAIGKRICREELKLAKSIFVDKEDRRVKDYLRKRGVQEDLGIL